MKFTCVFILLLCLFAATFSNWLIIASFNANQRYIATQLCVNRNNPNSKCNGHCYLCKQLNAQQKPDGAGNSNKEKFEVQLFFVEPSFFNPHGAALKAAFYNPPQIFSKQSFLKIFFHPPSAAV